MYTYNNIQEIVGLQIKGARDLSARYADAIVELEFEGTERVFVFGHYQDCCESVVLTEGFEDLKDLIGGTIISAEERIKRGSSTWTFYDIQTDIGFATLRFEGQSNGYYSESVDLYWRD